MFGFSHQDEACVHKKVSRSVMSVKLIYVLSSFHMLF